jgi:hypothetical protein
MFISKALKAFFLLAGLLTLWNTYLYRKKSKPEENFGYNEYIMKLIKAIGGFYSGLRRVITILIN